MVVAYPLLDACAASLFDMSMLHLPALSCTALHCIALHQVYTPAGYTKIGVLYISAGVFTAIVGLFWWFLVWSDLGLYVWSLGTLLMLHEMMVR